MKSIELTTIEEFKLVIDDVKTQLKADGLVNFTVIIKSTVVNDEIKSVIVRLEKAKHRR